MQVFFFLTESIFDSFFHNGSDFSRCLKDIDMMTLQFLQITILLLRISFYFCLLRKSKQHGDLKQQASFNNWVV